MRVETCYFCSSPAYPGKGMVFNRNDGKSLRFRSKSKCHKNFKMKRNPRKLKWTKAFRKSANKEMVVDRTLQFAARRNVPIRYNRELYAKVLKGMERVAEVRARRERVFYKNRMAGNRERRLEAARNLVANNEHLLPRLRGSEKRRLVEMAANEETVRMAEKETARRRVKAKVHGKETIRQRVTADGEVINEMEVVARSRPDGEDEGPNVDEGELGFDTAEGVSDDDIFGDDNDEMLVD